MPTSMRILGTAAFCCAAFSHAFASDGKAPFGDLPSWESKEKLGAGFVQLADLNEDGRLDLLVGTYESGYPKPPSNNFIYFGSDKGFGDAPSWVSVEQDFTPDGAVADFNKDGFLDFLAVNGGPAGDPNYIYLGSQQGLAKQASWAENTYTASLVGAVGDVNMDGFPDYFVANQSYNPQNPVAPATGYESTGKMIDPRYTWRSSYQIQGLGCDLGDIDSDGMRRGSATFKGDGQRRLFRIDQLNLQHISRVLVNGEPTRAYTRAWGSSYVSLPLAPAKDTVVTIEYAYSVDLDLVILPNTGGAYLHFNENGKIPADPAGQAGRSQLDNRVARLVDIDRDGDLDLFIGGRTTPMMLYYNNNGVFDETTAWVSADASPSVQEVAFGDIDGDGDLDMVTSHFAAKGAFRLYLNDGMALSKEPAWSVPGMSGTSVTLGDVNNDGKLDMIAGYANNAVRVYLNQR